MSADYENKTVALAGLQQALQLVQSIAWNNAYAYSQIDACLATLFRREPATYIEVYGDIEHIQAGLKALRTGFKDKRNKLALERSRYMADLMILSKKIIHDRRLAEQVGTTLSLLEEAAGNLDEQRHYLVERLAQLYKNAISRLHPRIIVYGKPHILSHDDNAALIRALLLAGLRSALLWRQAGGTHFDLLLGKAKYLSVIEQLLNTPASEY